MNLSTSVGNYLNSWENHNSLEPLTIQEVINMLLRSSDEEIQTEFNKLSAQHLWVEPLVNLFHDTLLERILDGATFIISTSWTNINDWKTNPKVILRIGFEDEYPILDGDGLIITPKREDTYTYNLVNDSFSEFFEKGIIKMMLNVDPIKMETLDAIVQIRPNQSQFEDQFQIVGLQSQTDPDSKIMFFKNGQDQNGSDGIKNEVTSFTDWSGFPDTEIMKVEVKIEEDLSFHIMQNMISSLVKRTFEVVDPMFQEHYEREKLITENLRKQEKRKQWVEKYGETTVDDWERDGYLDFATEE